MSDNSLYRCESIIQQIEVLAESSNGEITEDQLAELVQAQTASLALLGKLCGYIHHLESYIAAGTSEIERANKLVNSAKKRLASVKGYLTPYVAEQREKLGRPLNVGTNRLSVRHSQKVVITDDHFSENFPNECTKKVTYTPNKAMIEIYIKKHGNHPGAVLQPNISLQMK